jgi:hypothetical protein
VQRAKGKELKAKGQGQRAVSFCTELLHFALCPLLLGSLPLVLGDACATLRVLSDGMAKHSKFQIALEYALARSILAILGALPRRAAIAVGLGVGHIAYRLPGNLRRTGHRNLEIAFPDKSEKERRQLLRGSF